jgi:transcriptional regulator GlxA family with amidase domain
MRYLRQIRLARVHATLLAGSLRELTVAEAAIRWGFVHHGHFAAAYRTQFASETLHR